MRGQWTRHSRFEPLESRHLLSGFSTARFFASDRASFVVVAAETADEQPQVLPGPASAPLTSDDLRRDRREFMATQQPARWDWLADTHWYVPVENLLAYITPQDLSNPIPTGDQTLWYIETSENGRIVGQSVAQLSISSSPTSMPFTGVVASEGQIRFEFIPGDGAEPTTGIGQMRFVDGEWRMQMQMATPNSLLVTHWAYMTQYDPSDTPPTPDEFRPDLNLLSEEWRWIEGTTWQITDKSLFGKKAKSGTFTIDEYRNGYFWGSGQSKKPFNVLGSVTPEGNLLLLISIDGGKPEMRAGMLRETSSGGTMKFHSYDGGIAAGIAMTIDLGNSVLPSTSEINSLRRRNLFRP